MLNRRRFLGNTTSQVGVAALATLLASSSRAEESAPKAHAALPGFLNFAPKAKRIIYLFQSGAPSQMDLFDPKPELEKHRGEDLPESIRNETPANNLKLPMHDVVRSLNLASTANTVVYEAVRQFGGIL